MYTLIYCIYVFSFGKTHKHNNLAAPESLMISQVHKNLFKQYFISAVHFIQRNLEEALKYATKHSINYINYIIISLSDEL